MQNMHYIGLDVHQEDDQLLREAWQWRDSRPRYDSRHTLGPGPRSASGRWPHPALALN
jgi:hypothetical protein